MEGELGRALRRQEQVVRFKGGLLPETIHLGRVKNVLDVGCGVGVCGHRRWLYAIRLFVLLVSTTIQPHLQLLNYVYHKGHKM